MQHLENDMDELFQRAAIDYQLQPGDSRWDKIAPLLMTASESTQSNRRYTAAGLLLLIILMLAGITTQLNIYKTEPGISKEMGVRTTKFIPDESVTEDLNGMTMTNKIIGRPLFSDRQQTVTIDNVVSTGEAFIQNHVIPGPVNEKRPVEVVKQEIAADKRTDSLVADQPIGKKNKINPVITNHQHFYFGIAAGPQLNEVKGQGMKKAGLEIGLLAGYKFNKSISVETAVFFSQKNYFTDGKYFDINKAGSAMPSGMTIMNMEGHSNIIEIPIKLKYDVLQNSKRNLFATAGLSSYIMIKEKNNYHAIVNGNQESVTSSYHSSSRYAAACLNVSAGYEYHIGKQKTIRLEPYLQIPIKGIGIGAIPVTSAGLHIGILWNHN